MKVQRADAEQRAWKKAPALRVHWMRKVLRHAPQLGNSAKRERVIRRGKDFGQRRQEKLRSVNDKQWVRKSRVESKCNKLYFTSRRDDRAKQLVYSKGGATENREIRHRKDSSSN